MERRAETFEAIILKRTGGIGALKKSSQRGCRMLTIEALNRLVISLICIVGVSGPALLIG